MSRRLTTTFILIPNSCIKNILYMTEILQFLQILWDFRSPHSINTHIFWAVNTIGLVTVGVVHICTYIYVCVCACGYIGTYSDNQ